MKKNKLRYELCIAALLGDKIYNFGELILHDIFQEILNHHHQQHHLNIIGYIN